MLHFGMKPPFSFKKFLTMCHHIIPDRDVDIIKASSLLEEYPYEEINPTLKKWRAFDISLRNELVRIRAARKRIDPSKYLRYGGHMDLSIAHIALHAHRTPSLLEAEKILDQARWHFLDELSIGHYFDIDSLIIYANKLLILERWERINTLDKTRAAEELLESVNSL